MLKGLGGEGMNREVEEMDKGLLLVFPEVLRN